MKTPFLSLLTILIISAGASAAQKVHYACKAKSNSVITVQEDAAGSLSLNRSEIEKLPELDMTATTQKQILVTFPGDAVVEMLDNGNTEKITMNFHGTPSASQAVLTIDGQNMKISGTGAALVRIKSLMGDLDQGLIGCGISILQN